jgi:hypothetical protein
VLRRELYLDLRNEPHLRVPERVPQPLWSSPGEDDNLLQIARILRSVHAEKGAAEGRISGDSEEHPTANRLLYRESRRPLRKERCFRGDVVLQKSTVKRAGKEP